MALRTLWKLQAPWIVLSFHRVSECGRSNRACMIKECLSSTFSFTSLHFVHRFMLSGQVDAEQGMGKTRKEFSSKTRVNEATFIFLGFKLRFFHYQSPLPPPCFS